MQRHSPEFSKRLAHYGVAQVGHDKIHITDPVTWDKDNCPFTVKTIKTNDLDELKRLIGVPDSDAKQQSDTHRYLSSLSTLPEDRIFDAASAYIYGDSSTLKQHKAAIESKLGTREVQVATTNTLVVSSVITSSGINAIVADTIIFEPGGQIVNIGVLTINAGAIENLAT